MTSYWQRDAGWADRWTEPAIPREVDFAVLGAGLAGLTTAIRLREQNPSARIVVLEAERIGFGASGRNAGFLSPLAAPVWLLGAERSAEQAWGALRINTEVHAIARWLGEHVPDCELTPARLALQARGQLAAAALCEFTDAVARTGIAHRVGESRVSPGHPTLELAAYTLHPYKLVRELALHAERLGVQIRERARVFRVEALRAGGARVYLDEGGACEAGKAVVCTNAYTSSLDVGERVSALTVHSFMVATEPVGEPIARDGDFTVEVNAAQAYHRMHAGRVIYGGIDKLRAPAGKDGAVPGRERAQLARHMQRSFPGANLAIDHAWSGCFHTTVTGMPIIRMAADNHAIVFNVGYGGTGVALALACARIAASVASHGRFTNVDDTRLLALIHATRISARDSVRAVARIARRAAMPWLRA